MTAASFTYNHVESEGLTRKTSKKKRRRSRNVGQNVVHRNSKLDKDMYCFLAHIIQANHMIDTTVVSKAKGFTYS